MGEAERQNFRYSSAVLASLYGTTPATSWRCVLVVNKGTKGPAPSAAPSESYSNMGDMLEGLLDMVSGVEAFSQSVSYPAVAMTPLTIYRELKTA